MAGCGSGRLFNAKRADRGGLPIGGAMKAAVNHLEQFMEKADTAARQIDSWHEWNDLRWKPKDSSTPSRAVRARPVSSPSSASVALEGRMDVSSLDDRGQMSVFDHAGSSRYREVTDERAIGVRSRRDRLFD